MTEPNAPRSLKLVWIGVLVIIILAWIVYAMRGGPSTPDAPPLESGPGVQQQ